VNRPPRRFAAQRFRAGEQDKKRLARHRAGWHTPRMHTILGAGGVIANGLTGELLARGEKVRLVSRRGHVLPGTETIRADLADAAHTLAAVRGSRVVYLVVGLPYRASVWRHLWPHVMRNVLEACKRTGARLVFFDNVYAYGRVAGPMTESTPFNPCSRKGEVRALIATDLLEEIKEGVLTALVARAPDFYGPNCATSVANLFVVDRLAAGVKALWPGRDDVPHSMIFTPDAARAVALLGTSETAWNQTWHLPTAAPAPTGREFVEAVAQALGVPARHATVGGVMLRLAGLFNGDARESVEMLYQHEHPYVFDATKFTTAFGFTPTPCAEGVRQTVAAKKAG
jgi:nucleoside-diphosphate-sugar epimerase